MTSPRQYTRQFLKWGWGKRQLAGKAARDQTATNHQVSRENGQVANRNGAPPIPDRQMSTPEMQQHGPSVHTEAGSDSHNNTPSLLSESQSQQSTKEAKLSQALQKANNAVLLDNAQNEAAIDEYQQACRLLREAMQEASTETDRRKLETIVGLDYH